MRATAEESRAGRRPCVMGDLQPRSSGEPSSTIGITILDLDRTLTRKGTYSPFLLHAAWHSAPWRLVLVPVVLLAMIAYKLGAIRRRTLKQWMHRLMLGRRMPRWRVDRLAESFAEKVVATGMSREAIALVEDERRAGRLLILATAAHRFYAEAIARRLGIAHVVATESQWLAGMLLPSIAGENCHGPSKAAALALYLGRLGLDRSSIRLRCYSDDASDVPSFEASDECVAVNPCPKLARIAAHRGWRVLRLR